MMKFIAIAVSGVFAIAALAAGLLYKSESDKNNLLRTENLKTADEAQTEMKELKEDIKKERDKSLDDKQKLLDQMNQLSKEKDKAVKEAEEVKKGVLKEREISLVAGDDLEKLRKEVAAIAREGKDGIKQLEESFRKKQQSYETRILSSEAQLAKAKAKISSEADRYHYNLGVVYTQNKDFDSAVKEFKTALGYNPKNAQAHYNLGIIYDDYFKDRENAKYHYRNYLELSPDSDDAEAVKEWLANLDK
ncbi:MAG: tetratricopeptide repeat protein [Candidatus Omnitrophota bacterium]